MNRELEKAAAYLEREPLRYVDMLEPLRRGMVEVAALGEQGVLLYNVPGELYMLAAESLQAGQALCAGVQDMDLVVTHDRETGEYLRKRYGIERCQPCTQAVYTGEASFPVGKEVEIRRLGQESFSVILETYHSFTDPGYIRRRLEAGVMHGGNAGGAADLSPARGGHGPAGLYGQLVPGAGMDSLFSDLGRQHGLSGTAQTPGLDPVPGTSVLGDELLKGRGTFPRWPLSVHLT